MTNFPRIFKNSIYTKNLILPIVAALLFTSCDSVSKSDDNGEFCTQELRTSAVTIVQEQNKQPVDSLQIRVINKESGGVLDICEDLSCSGSPKSHSGTYTIFHDGFEDEVDPAGEEILVEGSKGDSLSFSQEYTFGSDGCHIEKFAGPDTIFVSINTE